MIFAFKNHLCLRIAYQQTLNSGKHSVGMTFRGGKVSVGMSACLAGKVSVGMTGCFLFRIILFLPQDFSIKW